MDGGIAREWESLCGRYSKSSGTKGVIGQREVQEVSGSPGGAIRIDQC
jgi:hypothetical protein